MAPSTLLADFPPVPAAAEIGQFVVCLILLAYFANQLKKLFGWDRPADEASATKGELTKLSAQVALCATKSELKTLQKEIDTKYDKLEQYSRERAHDTINAVNALQLNLEKMRVELIKEITLAVQRIEDRHNERLLEKLDRTHGTKRGD